MNASRRFASRDYVYEGLNDLRVVLERMNLRAYSPEAYARRDAHESVLLGMKCVDREPMKALFMLGLALGAASRGDLLTAEEYARVETNALRGAS